MFAAPFVNNFAAYLIGSPNGAQTSFTDYLKRTKLIASGDGGYLGANYDYTTFTKFVSKTMYEKKAFVDFLKVCMISYPIIFCFISQNMFYKCLFNLL
jgi:hypothetical protein